jgi:hypothetical protein
MTEQEKSPQSRDAKERRRQRLELIQRFADDVAKWPSWMVRAGYAQPETVRRAEERERRESQQSRSHA